MSLNGQKARMADEAEARASTKVNAAGPVQPGSVSTYAPCGECPKDECDRCEWCVYFESLP